MTQTRDFFVTKEQHFRRAKARPLHPILVWLANRRLVSPYSWLQLPWNVILCMTSSAQTSSSRQNLTISTARQRSNKILAWWLVEIYLNSLYMLDLVLCFLQNKNYKEEITLPTSCGTYIAPLFCLRNWGIGFWTLTELELWSLN